MGGFFLEVFALFYMLGPLSHAFVGCLGIFKSAKSGEFQTGGDTQWADKLSRQSPDSTERPKIVAKLRRKLLILKSEIETADISIAQRLAIGRLLQRGTQNKFLDQWTKHEGKEYAELMAMLLQGSNGTNGGTPLESRGRGKKMGGQATGWIGYGVAAAIGAILGLGNFLMGHLKTDLTIGGYTKSFAVRHAARFEDVTNAAISFIIGLVAGQQLDVLAWLSLGTLSPPLGIILPVGLVIGIWFLLFMGSHAIFSTALERVLDEKPSDDKASRLFRYYLVPLTLTALLGYGLAAHDLSPYLSFILPISMFNFIRTAHDRINLFNGKRVGEGPRIFSVSVLLAVLLFVPLSVFARSAPLQPAIPVAVEKVAPWKEQAIQDLRRKFGDYEVAQAILEEQERITKKFFPEVKDEVLEKMASLVRPNKNAEGWGSSTKILIPEVWVLGSVEGVRIFVAHETAHLLFRPYSKGSNPPLDSDFKAYRHQIHSVIYAMGFLRGMELGLEGKYGMFRSGVLGWGSIINHSANHHFHVGYDLAKEAWELELGTPGKGWEFLRGKLDKKSELERRDLVGFLTLPALVYFVYPLIGLAFFLLYMKDRNWDGSATSRWAVKFAEWIGSKVDPVKGREIFGVFYKRFAASIEWSVSANIAFWGFMGSLAFLGAPLGWAVAPAAGAVYGILFVASHYIPKTMAPVTEVKVGGVQALTMGVIYGVLIGTTPFLLGAVPLLGIPEFGIQAGGVLWALAGLLHHSFDKENLREEGKEAAWKLIKQLSHVQGSFETMMPGVHNGHTEEIVGKGSSSPEWLTETLSRLKTDEEFRAGFVGAVQTAIGDQKLSGASMNLLSAMVMAATGQPLAYVHFLGNSSQEFETLYRLTERSEGKTSSGFSVALVVSQSQRTDYKTVIDVFVARGVSVFSVNLHAQGWTQEALVRLDSEMSPFLAKANGVVATVGGKVGINSRDVEALDRHSKLRAMLKIAMTLGETVQAFLRILQALASNA